MWLRRRPTGLSLVMWIVVLACLAACASVDEPRPADAIDWKQRVEDLEARADALERELEKCEENRSQAELAAAECADRIAELEAELATALPELSAAEMAEVADAQRIEELEAALEEQSRELALQQEELRSTEWVLSAYAESKEGLVVDEERSPEEVELFYATTRARKGRSESQAGLGPDNRDRPAGGSESELDLRALLAPLVCLLLFLALPPLFRRVLKPEFQRGSVLVARGVFGALFLILGFLAAKSLFIGWDRGRGLEPGFTDERRADGSSYELGTCTVTIPPTHREGFVEDLAIWEFRRDPAKHFTLKPLEPPLDPDQFYAKLKSRVKDSQELFLFVHGYLNTFEDAAFRTAQIHHDLGFQGAPMLFSWPTGNKNYLASENNWLLASDALKEFLGDMLVQIDDETTIHLLAHSMGSRVLTQAVRLLRAELSTQTRFAELILAAPDIDAETFRGWAGQITPMARRVTVYASSKDRALQVSQLIHGGAPRAGQAPPEQVFPQVDTIDVSMVTSGHSYLADSGRILEDLGALLTGRRPMGELDASIATKECLEGAAGQCYWVLR